MGKSEIIFHRTRNAKLGAPATAALNFRRSPAYARTLVLRMPTFRATLRKVGPLYAVEVPAAVLTALGGAKKIPVIVRYLGDAHASTVTPARGGRGRLFLRVDVFRPRGLGVGDALEISLTPDRSPRVLAVPPDLQRALQFRPAALAGWDRAAPSTRRVVVDHLHEARSSGTRERRIEKLVEHFAEKAAAHAMKRS